MAGFFALLFFVAAFFAGALRFLPLLAALGIQQFDSAIPWSNLRARLPWAIVALTFSHFTYGPYLPFHDVAPHRRFRDARPVPARFWRHLPRPPRLGTFSASKLHGSVHADGKYFLDALEVGIGAAPFTGAFSMFQIGAVTPDIGPHHNPVIGMRTNRAGQ